FQSREKARNSIMAGVVYVNGIREDKPGTRFKRDVEITIKENINPFVSRGGLKLEKALDIFNIDLQGKTAIDVGASTGGFTDCMLKRGAAKVIAIDVGYGQLAWELRNDERVICMERTNIRYVKPGDIQLIADFAAIDVSFISLKKVLPAVINLIGPEGEIVSLVKPQFEAGREKVGKGGVVREKETHVEVLENVVDTVLETGLCIKGLTYSPIKGPEGNIEYLLYSSKILSDFSRTNLKSNIREVVNESHEKL
ncbi:MAG: TlyA family RNA methyltransferase, partial [Clostridiaceae bacterium]|nr:TlyA family RNA methyltransferase [Clostridiaceae bacterium]